MNPQIAHLAIKLFHEAKMSLDEYIKWEATRNPQSQCLGELGIEDLAVAGITEEFSRSLALFNSVFGRALSNNIHSNLNPERRASDYPIGKDIQKTIEIYRAPDIEIYRKAEEFFKREAARRGI